MKTYEKLQKLDQEYHELRQQILMGQVESFELKIVSKAKESAVLLKPKKNASK